MSDQIKEKNKVKRTVLLFSTLFIITGVTLISITFIDNKINDVKDNEVLESFIANQDIVEEEVIEEKPESNEPQNKEQYLGVLEIPKIKLMRGFYNKNSKNNNVNKNIYLIKESELPNQDKGNLLLAAHSGNSRVAFFNDLKKLETGDSAFIIYQGKKYQYELMNRYEIDKTGNNITMTEVVKDLNKEMATKISNIQKNNQHDDYVINTNRAEWKDVLTIYAAKISNGTMEQEVMTLDDNKINTLKTIFWDMHEISYEVKTEIIEDDELERSDYTSEQKVLYITITSKTVEQMMNEYSFSIQQREQVQELLKDDYASLWAAPIYGISLGSPNMVTIALSQVGNVGGEPYWSWYGFNSRVAWCACFVSWVAYQSGYIQNAIIPKFAGVRNGVDWFKAMDEWHDKNYVPHSGDIIFFDWENDGKANHVGIVEKVENNKVYTIEGNSNDECKQKEYSLNSNVIYGYGVPLY